MLAMLALIPGIGPWLAGAAAVVKPAVSAAGSAVASILTNPMVQGALVTVGAILFWHIEEGRVGAARTAGATAAAMSHQAFQIEQASFNQVNTALDAQTKGIRSLVQESAARTKSAQQAQQQAQKATASAQAVAAHIAAYKATGDAGQAALDILQGKADQ